MGLGLVFELPVLIFFLSRIGVVTPAFLWRNFRYAVLVIAVLSAVLTPTGDVVTMSVGTGRYRQVVIVPEGAPEYEEAEAASREAEASSAARDSRD